MNDDERVDLSALKMSGSRFEELVAATGARLEESLLQRRRGSDPVTVVYGWRRPILTAAAVLLAILIPVEFALEMRERNAERVHALVQVSGDAARGLRQPSPAELLKALGRGRSQ